jgi:Mn2+/Fe2+ NRAMP family transporter
MYWISKSIHQLRRFRRRTWIFLAALGPGVITMVADNDAGGILTYSQTGAKYQFSFLWIFFLLIPMAYFVQEMTVRLGAVTKRGNAEAIFDGFGPFWGWFSIFDLAVVNWLTLVTEYIGMTEALSLFGIPAAITYLVVTAILMAVVVTGRYWTFEKITLFFCAFNLVYIPAALWAMEMPDAPSWGKVASGFWGAGFPAFSQGVLFMVMANIGTTITPWQIFFQQSAVVDKGMDERDIKLGKVDTFLGSFLTGVVAMFIIIVTGAALYRQEFERVTDVAAALEPLLPEGKGQWAQRLFAIGLFDAGFLGALCISLSTSWAVGEVFGWAHSLNKSVRDAPWFYVVYLATLLTAGAIVLIPGAPLATITMFVQVVAVSLLPAALLFLILLLNDRPLMGESVNTRWQNIANWSITIFVIAISTLYGISVFLKEILDYDISVVFTRLFGPGG